MKARPWLDRLVELRACREAMDWADQFDDPQTLWDSCHRGDWMLWWLGKEAGEPWSDSRRPLVGCCAMAATLAPTTEDGEHEMARAWAIGASLRWANGESSEDELRASAAAAYAAYARAAYASAAYAYAAYAAADAASASATRGRVLAEAADIVREWFPHPPEPRKETTP